MAGYDAFISYSHADGTVAPAVQRGLERLARPWNRRRALHVFRDGTDLTASPHLWGSIVASMDVSRWFVLICSPAATRSEWVGKEIEHWLASPDGGPERMLLVVAAGTCDWDEHGFTAATDCVPAAARAALTDEPTYVDLTVAADPTHLDLKQPAFQEAIARIAAPIHGPDVKPADLIGEDLRQFKLAKRFRRAALIGLTVLTVAALIASVVAVVQQRRAESNAAQSRARELAATAKNTMADDPALGALLALEAVYPGGATSPTGPRDARHLLGAALRNLQWASVTAAAPRITGRTDYIAWSDSRVIATVDFSNCCTKLDWWDRATGRRTTPALSEPAERALLERYGSSRFTVSSASESPPVLADGDVTDPFTFTDDGTLVGWAPTRREFVVRGTDGVVRRHLAMPGGPDPTLVVALASGRVVALDQDGGLHQWSPATGDVAAPVPYRPWYGTVRSIAAAGDDTILVDSADGGPTQPHRACSVVCRDDVTVVSDVFGGFVGSAFTDPTLAVVDLTQPTPEAPTVAEPSVTVRGSYAVAPAAAGHRLVAARTIGLDAAGTADVGVWDVEARRLVARIPTLAPTDLRWLDAETLAIASARGLAQVRIHMPAAVSEPVRDLAVAGDGRTRVALPTVGSRPVRVAPAPRGRATVGAAPVPALGLPTPGRLALDARGRLTATVVPRSAPPGVGCVVPTGPACAAPTSVRLARVGHRRAIDQFIGARATAFAPDGNRVAVAYRGRIDIVHVRARDRASRSIRVPGFLPQVVAWASHSDDVIVSGQDAETSRVLHVDAASGRVRRLVGAGSCPLLGGIDCSPLAVSADGRRVATSAPGGVVELWTRRGGTFLREASLVAAAQQPTGLALDADGTRLITSGADATTVWDLSRPANPRATEVLSALPALAHTSTPNIPVAANLPQPPTPWGLAAFAPDARSITLAGSGGVVTLADFDPGLVCSLVTAGDLRAAARVLGAPSACVRVDALRRSVAAPSARARRAASFAHHGQRAGRVRDGARARHRVGHGRGDRPRGRRDPGPAPARR